MKRIALVIALGAASPLWVVAAGLIGAAIGAIGLAKLLIDIATQEPR